VTRHTKALKTKLKQTVKFTPLDVVVAEHTHVSPYLNSLSVPTCLSIHNVEYLSLLSSARSLFPRPASLAYTFDSARMWIFENKLFESKAPDACLFLSKKEQRIASTKFPDNQDKFVHIPAGVKMQPLSKVVPNSEGDDPTLIFTGTMRYPPNVEAVTWFVNDVLPKIHKRHSSVEFQIVGKDPTDEVQQLEQADGVTVTGRVDSTKPYLLSADVSVIPLHQATGTQLKLLESLAVGNPTVATSLAVEGAEVKSGKHVVVADKSREFASEVCHLLDNTEAATELGLRGRDLVEQEYSVQACVSKLESTLMNLIEDSV
jgi:glycosyltransferase involved in cell wall biosynthesis